MNNLKKIRLDPDAFDQGMKQRGVHISSVDILTRDAQIRELKTDLNVLRTKKNSIAKEISMPDSDKEHLMKEGADVKVKIHEIETLLADREKELHDILMSLPNIPSHEVPYGEGENDNVVLKYVGEAPKFNFSPRSHTEIGEMRHQIDFEKAAKMSGRRFVVLSGEITKLERAVTNFMLDFQANEFGYEEVSVPFLVRDEAMYNAGQLPKFAADSFSVSGDYRLIPTGEVPLINMVANSTIDEKRLPMRFVANTPCFRSEAGSAGKDTHGMMRMHQFHKVELVSICAETDSEIEHDRILMSAEGILQKLGLHYRVSLLCSQDMGFSAKKTYDIEVWLPGEDRYREISSCSNCGDFQAARMNTFYKKGDEHEKVLVHTLNGSGLAVGRTMIAIIENYQNEDGSIRIPDVLIPYMNGVDVI